MEVMTQNLSQWFYIGLGGLLVGLYLIYRAKGQTKSRAMENGYFILILGFIGVVSEWTDFATVLCILVLITGGLIILDKTFAAKWRHKRNKHHNLVSITMPHYIHYAYEFFPVLFAVFILRAFLFEAYQIPSSSMRPSLTVGDFILVNKFDYGIREPFTNLVIIPIGQVKRGDVVVFKDRLVRNRDLIKRVIGVPGDTVAYYNKRLIINGVPLKYSQLANYSYSENIPTQGRITIDNQQYLEDLLGVKHRIITWDKVPPIFSSEVQTFPNSQNCVYQGDNGFKCVVPANEYFMLGDNRDNSFDSRYWGFVSNQEILGKAFYVWMNLHDFKRIGNTI